jgi:PPOX class probable F420-dependent enzyme
MPAIAIVPESHRDLTDRKVCVLSTIGPSGRPQCTAIWFLLDGDGIVRTSLTADRQKYKNMVANPKATIFVLDPANPFRTLEIRCDVSVGPDPDLAMMRRVLAFYGADFDTFPAPKENRVKVELTPVRVIANG